MTRPSALPTANGCVHGRCDPGSIVLATWLTNLVLPGLLAVVVAGLTHKLSVSRLILQDERAAATATEQALSQLELRAYAGPGSASELRHEWTDAARPQGMRVNSPEILARVELVGKVLLLAHQSHERDESWRHAAGVCIEEARAALRAYLSRKPLPSPTFPKDLELQRMTCEGLDTLFERINARLAANNC